MSRLGISFLIACLLTLVGMHFIIPNPNLFLALIYFSLGFIAAWCCSEVFPRERKIEYEEDSDTEEAV